MSRLAVMSSAGHAPEFRRWMPPDVAFDEKAPPPSPPPPPADPGPTPEEIAAIKEAARQEGAEAGYRAGYDKGYQEGCEKAAQEAAAEQRKREAREQAWRDSEEQTLKTTVAALEDIARELADPLASSADALEPELLALVSAMARQVVMAELAARPSLIQQVLHEALGQLPSRNHAVRIHVHPEDQRILDAFAVEQGESFAWIADPTLERGGCILESGPSRIDASLEVRLRQGIEAIWGELTRPEPLPEVSDASPTGGEQDMACAAPHAPEPEPGIETETAQAESSETPEALPAETQP